MNVECVWEKLYKAVLQTERIAGKNTTLPILEAVLLIAKENTLIIRATNLDAGIEITIPVKTKKDGVVAVPAKVFLSTLSNIGKNNNIILTENNKNLIIGYGENTTHINTLPYEEFPTLPSISGKQKFTVDCKKFIKGIKSVVYSASVSDIKPELSSVYIYPKENFLIFVSTDSFRLAEKKIPVKNIQLFDGIIIPFKNTLEIIRVFEEQQGNIEVIFNKNQISLLLNNIYFTSRVIDGVFPDYKQIIPKEHKTEVIVLKQDLIDALKISNVFSNKFNQILITITPSKKTIHIQTTNRDVGGSSIYIEGTIKGEQVNIHINHKYVSEMFQSIHQDSVSLLFNGDNKPIVLRGVGDNTFTYLVMPMNQ